MALALNVSAQTVLVDEDWQTPLTNNKVRVDLISVFPNWTFNSETYSYRENNETWVPGDSYTNYPNQIIEQNQTGCYADYDISHNWASSDTYYLMVEASPHSWSGENQRYVRPEIRQQDNTLLWQAPQDSTTAVPLYSQISSYLDDWNSEQRFWFTIDAGTDFIGGTEGQPIKLRLAHSGSRGLGFNNVKLTLLPITDTNPPTPDPLTWDSNPAVVDFTNITMTIGSARDDWYDVEYLFSNTVNNLTSGWQDERTWTEIGLDYGTLYTYQVIARD